MLEIEKRCVLARTGRWLKDEQSISVPAIAFIHTNRIQAPDYAEIILSTRKSGSEKVEIVDQGSSFLPLVETGDVTIAPDYPFPLGFEDLDVEIESESSKVEGVVIRPGDRETPSGAAKDGIRLFVIGNSVELLRHPKDFVKEIVEIRKRVGYDSLLYMPGIGTPSNLALMLYCGADILDDSRTIWESRSGNLLGPEGRLSRADAIDYVCHCPGCSKGEDFENILEHNHLALQRELGLARHHITKGTLREFVEKRCVHDPWMIAVLRTFDKAFYDFQELHFPVTGPRFSANTKESIFRPDVVRFRGRIPERYRRPGSARVLVLLPCSARKPYSLSRTHRLFRKAIRDSGAQSVVHEVIITSPLGIVPRELEIFYPAQSYDIPVTGEWFEDEISIIAADLRKYLAENEYEQAIVHIGGLESHLIKVLSEAGYSDRHKITVMDDRPTSAESLKRLTKELSEVCEEYDRISSAERKREEMQSRCMFQFGLREGETLMENSEVKGRYPNLKIFSNGKQLGMFVEERAMIALTLDGAERINMTGEKHYADPDAWDSYCVEIDDFYPEGDVFAIGVLEANALIRIGDEAIIRHRKEVRAVGVAAMNYSEMVASNRGEAVRVRHRKKG